MPLLYVLIELVILFLFSQQLTKSLSRLLFSCTRNQGATLYLLSLIFLPGVIIHELSHVFIAGILFVPVGEIEFFPKMIGNSVKLGSVMVGKTDPVRRLLIGIGPLFVGVVLIFSAFFYLSPLAWSIAWWKVCILVYLLFEIGNTMFSSKKDLEGSLVLGVFVSLLGGAGMLIGVSQAFLAYLLQPAIVSLLQTLHIFLLVIIAIDCFFYLCISLLLKKFRG